MTAYQFTSRIYISPTKKLGSLKTGGGALSESVTAGLSGNSEVTTGESPSATLEGCEDKDHPCNK